MQNSIHLYKGNQSSVHMISMGMVDFAKVITERQHNELYFNPHFIVRVFPNHTRIIQ